MSKLLDDVRNVLRVRHYSYQTEKTYIHWIRQYWGRHLWSRGYCVSTVGIDEERIREYVRWQEKKEQEMEQLQGELFDEAED